MPNLNTEIMAAIPFAVPPLPEQKRIAHILGALDDKIELNRRMNATLEGISRAIFKSWFVDFDPVRQKAAGKKPVGMDAQTAALFPDSFEDSEIGEVPKGWGVDAFADHFDADRGLSYKGEGLRDDGSGVPMHNLNSIYEGGGYKHEGIKYYAGEYRDKHLIAPGDVIVTNTEQGFDHLLIGHAAIVPACFGPTGLYSHHIYRVRCKPSSPLTPHYVVSLLNDPRWHYWISGFSNGTTINMLPLDALQMPLLVVPPRRLVQAFDQLAASTHERREANLRQSRTLAALRDTLLPKLLSGEVRVPEAEHAVEEAVR
jgi:type I restriction enzyme S subunit